ncbi:MAG: lytic transglycosylase domain-containing protein [Kiritimatiellae bacterium]|nr:lytic transglycosylase domain-containing protein [Kiritimatiellia bacterium]MDD5522547.1 lytic transglycosylase domain-containing protein [Kiritimatiellia bacterium]
MRRFNCITIHCILVLVLTGYSPATAQNDQINIGDILQSGEQWVQENIDPDVLRFLGDMDQAKVQKLIRDFQQWLHGDQVANIASIKETAAVVLPLMEKYEETWPYAVWLKTRLDYLEMADQFKHTLPPPKVEPGQPLKPIPNPEPEVERKAWKKQLEKRPLPKGAEKYVARLKPIFAAQKVPEKLVWLAEVESSFTPSARSPAGAAGMFQLMPRTAKLYGLSSWPRDERYQPEKSAKAAARYLKYLHGEFDNWPLALAAYNAGEGRVRNLLNRHKAKSFDKIATHLPAETQMYVPKIEATLLRREGITLSQLSGPES